MFPMKFAIPCDHAGKEPPFEAMYHEKDSASSWVLIDTDSTYRISRSHNETDEVPIIDGQVNPHPFAEHPLPSSLSHYW